MMVMMTIGSASHGWMRVRCWGAPLVNRRMPTRMLGRGMMRVTLHVFYGARRAEWITLLVCSWFCALNFNLKRYEP